MSKAAFGRKQRFAYKMDHILSGGPGPIMGLLFLVVLAVVLLAAFLLALFGVTVDGVKLGFLEAFWTSLMRSFDAGTMSGDLGWPFRLVSLMVTLGGILILSSLIGVIANVIDQRLTLLQRGRSHVAETEHVLILGWSPKIFTVVAELIVAGQSRSDNCIVVLASVEKQEMEEQLESRIEEWGPTRLVCRTGDPSDPADLAIVNPTGARSVLILNAGAENEDAHVAKVVLSLAKKGVADSGIPIITEMSDETHAIALRKAVGAGVTIIEPMHIIARIAAQACRRPGLGAALQELLDFEGHEIYFRQQPELVGRTFGDCLFAFEQCAVMGIYRSDDGCVLNPPMDSMIGVEDQLIVIAEDDASIRFTGVNPVQATGSPVLEREVAPAERFLVVGWSRLGRLMLQELDHYVGPGSSVLILADRDHLGDVMPEHSMNNIAIDVTSNPEHVEDPAGLLMLRSFDHVVLLCYRDDDMNVAGARTLMTLLQLRNALQGSDGSTNIVAELIDVRDVELVPDMDAAEFLLSERLSSLLMSQLSENVQLSPVFDDLFDPEGAELYVKPIAMYGGPGSHSFGGLVASAAMRKETAIGYRRRVGREFEVVINPAKSSVAELGSEDAVLVLADEDG